MTLIDTATELLVRLEAASEDDAGDELLSRGLVVRQQLSAASDHFEAVNAYRHAIGGSHQPTIDGKEVRQAIGRFRGALSKSGPRAFQQQSAATLLEVAEAEIKRVDRWVRSAWRDRFSAANEFIERVEAGELHGSLSDLTRAKSRAQRLKAVIKTDPIRDRAELEDLLKVEGLANCLSRADESIEELKAAIEAIDLEEAAMPPGVREVLRRSASDEGLPLQELTPELLAALESAGVIGDLAVRRS